MEQRRLSAAQDGQDVRSYRCSFCGKHARQVRRIIAGSRVNICDECLELCNEIISEEFSHLEEARRTKIPSPKDIYQHLDQYVIGQNDAKRTLSVAVYNHYKCISPYGSVKKQEKSIEVAKSNVLLMGPTGTGKTYLAQTLAKIMDVPFVIVDATALTEAGYIGEDVENILLRLIQNAGGDIEKAQTGIIYIDEIDKLARRTDSSSLTRDVSGEGVQQALLKIIEGTTASVPPAGGRKHPHQEFVNINTANILFIVSGAFSGLDEIVIRRTTKTGVGFGAPLRTKTSAQKDVLKDVQTDDLQKFGMIPEFIGRLPVITYVRDLDEKQLCAILVEPKNSLIDQYRKLFEYDNVYLQFDDDAITGIARLAKKRGIGARGLRSILEKILEPIMFEIPSMSDVEGVIVTRECVDAYENGTTEQPRIINKLVQKSTRTLKSSACTHGKQSGS
ncbi:MAG: ATP-dependent Clp protease ATP-binding subunit ClpX [Candidatus Ancillula trichonymphae]|jgi:ATP-dependent Clp protease ATP-binding subunit ClpX|nr:ATP-dependent Clp protease ATP-binding subunit ClpX [Candidatus Ancillula trichonymphae]